MSYPTRNVSFIDYRHEPMNTGAVGDDWWSRGQVIYCCSEGSVYDPSDGARVLAGPAPQPLAAVSLEYEADEQALYATGVYGGDLLERFLNEFGFQVALTHKNNDIRRPVRDITRDGLADERVFAHRRVLGLADPRGIERSPGNPRRLRSLPRYCRCGP